MMQVGVERVVSALTCLDNRAVRIYPGQCSKLRHRRSACTLCVDACPVQAITWNGSLQVNEEQCTACGACTTVCPTSALEAQAPTDSELLARLEARARQRSSVGFACPRYLAAEGGNDPRFVPVQCLARLDEAVLVGAVAVGIESVWLMDGACEDCRQAACRAIAEQTVQRSNALLQALGAAESITIGPRFPEELCGKAEPSAEDPSRRAFFNLLARQVARTAAETVKSVHGEEDGRPGQEAQAPQKGELPARLPPRRQLLLAALARLETGAPGHPIDGGLFAQLRFDKTCSGCQMCAFFCPTGALTKVQRDGQAGVAFRVAYCVDCGLCRDICYRDALDLNGRVKLNHVLDDLIEIVLMQDAAAVSGRAPSEEKIQRLLEAMHPKSE